MPARYSFSSGPIRLGVRLSASVVKFGNVREHRGDVAPLGAEVDIIRRRGEPVRQARREIPGKLCPRPFRLLLAPLVAAGDLQIAQGLVDGRFEIGEVDRLGQEVEGAAVHRGADIGHVAVGGDDDRGQVLLALLQPAEQRQPVHPRHVDVADDHVDLGIVSQHSQRVHAVLGKDEAELAIADLPPEALDNQQFQIRLIVDDENARSHPLLVASATTRDTSCFSCGKSTGLVMNLLAPRSSAVLTLSASP